MRLLSFACLLVALLMPAAAFAQGRMMSAEAVPVGTPIHWSYARDGAVARYRAGDVGLTVRAQARGDEIDPALLVEPVVTVEMPGFAPVEVELGSLMVSHSSTIAVGRWDDQRRYVLLQSFTGGAHCCNSVQAVVPRGRRLELVDLGEWDGVPLDALPTDLDGDGRLDFVFRDDSFLYLFASYADSYAPPLILNIVDGRTENVSDRPGFRPLFEQARREARAGCVASDARAVPNGYCAAYVAAAARVGRFEEAWAEMLTHFDMNSDWELPTDCRVEFVDGQCPAQALVRFEDYPSALRHFMVAAGYIGK